MKLFYFWFRRWRQREARRSDETWNGNCDVVGPNKERFARTNRNHQESRRRLDTSYWGKDKAE
jgi:hypothetical protein